MINIQLVYVIIFIILFETNDAEFASSAYMEMILLEPPKSKGDTSWVAKLRKASIGYNSTFLLYF